MYKRWSKYVYKDWLNLKGVTIKVCKQATFDNFTNLLILATEGKGGRGFGDISFQFISIRAPRSFTQLIQTTCQNNCCCWTNLQSLNISSGFQAMGRSLKTPRIHLAIFAVTQTNLLAKIEIHFFDSFHSGSASWPTLG